MRIAGLGIDPGKNSCGVAGLDDTGRAVLRRRMQRESVITLASGMTPCVTGLLLERGMTVPQGRRKLTHHLPAVLDGDDAPLSPRLRPRIADMRAEWAALEHRLEVYDDEVAAQAKTDHAARRLASIPGRGVLTATAPVAAVGNAATVARGRALAAWLGREPRQMTTGGTPRPLGITRRGNNYPRKRLVHGARAALPSLSVGMTPLGKWLRSLLERAHKDTVVGALATTLARLVGAVLRHGGTYDAAVTAA